MAVKGRGTCLIPRANGTPCGRQILDGEPGGTVLLGMAGGVHGHKRCADDWLQRKQATEREKVRESMVQRIDQAGPGGPLGPPRDALLGGVPLAEQVANEEAKKDALAAASAVAGVRSVADVPFDEGTGETVVDPATYPATFGQVHSSLTKEEHDELEAYKARLLAKRKPPPADLTFDVPPGATKATLHFQ